MIFNPATVSAEVTDRLAAFPFVQELSEEGHGELCEATLGRRFEKGLHLLDEGSPCEAMLLVERGAIRVYKGTGGGREITLYQVRPGESCVLGTSCLLGGNRYPAQAMVEEPCDALVVPAPTFRRLHETEMAVRQFVLGLFSRRLTSLMLLVDEVAFRRMDERLGRFLLEQARQSPGLYRPVAMSHEQLAAHIGTAREVVSRLLQQFAEEGLITLERRLVHIADPDKLAGRCSVS